MSEQENKDLLSRDSIEDWLKKMQRGLYELTVDMESKESWTVDTEKAALLLKNVTHKLRHDPDYLLVKKDDEPVINDLIYMLGHMSTSQAFRVLNLAVHKQEEITGKLSRAAQMHCANRSDLHPEARVMVDRLLVIIRWRCFALVFGPKRRADILAILEQGA